MQICAESNIYYMWFGVEVKNVILFLTAAKVKHGIDTQPMCFYTSVV